MTLRSQNKNCTSEFIAKRIETCEMFIRRNICHEVKLYCRWTKSHNRNISPNSESGKDTLIPTTKDFYITNKRIRHGYTISTSSNDKALNCDF